MMNAIVQRKYGNPDVLTLEQVARPVPGPREVLVKVHAATANIGDHHVVTGKPYPIRLSPFGGLPRPKNPVPGQTMAGVVEAVGAEVTTTKPGDEVLGQAPNGAFAEYLVVAETLIAPKPKNISFDEAAAVPWAVTALQGLKVGGLKPGQRVLINGASGGVGTWAVQLAKAMGAHVTAVCSTRNVARMRELGADDVIDYTQEDFTAGGARFDLMFDLVGSRTLKACRSVLVPEGTYVASSGEGGDWFGPAFRIIGMLVLGLFAKQKLKTFMASPNREDFIALTAFVESGKAKPVIERRYPLAQTAQALEHVGAGRSQGQTVIRIAA